MTPHAQRAKKTKVHQLIQEHSSLNRNEAGNAQDQNTQDARVKEIRQELVKIFHDGQENN